MNNPNNSHQTAFAVGEGSLIHNQAERGQQWGHKQGEAYRLPWLNLGKTVEGAMTWQEAMEKADLDWTVSKVPTYFKNPKYDAKVKDSKRGYQVPDSFIVVRDDIEGEGSVLGRHVTSSYTPVQNKFMFDFVDGILENVGGAHYEAAGVLGTGQAVWVLARVPNLDFTVGKKDKHETYILFKSSHDGSMACSACLCTVRLACWNTQQYSVHIGDVKAMVKIRHTKTAVVRFNQVKKMWSGLKQNVNTIKEKLNRLSKVKATKEVFTNVMKEVFGKDWMDSTRKQNIAVEIARIFESNDNNTFPEQKGTAFNLLNAFTDYADHHRSTRVTSNPMKKHYTPEMARSEAALVGSGMQIKDKALDTILELTKDAEEYNPVENGNAQGSIDSIMSQVVFPNSNN